MRNSRSNTRKETNGRSINAVIPLALAAALVLPTGVNAITPIGQQKGVSGYLMAGIGTTDVKSNMVAGNDVVDGGIETVGSIYDSPRSTDGGHGIAGFELNYTLEDRNQIFIGSSLQDQLTMDFGSQIGWRKQTENAGIFQLGYLFTGVPAELWKDPYLTGVKRKATERDSNGVRFVWDRIMGSALEFTAQTREIDVHRERSGSDPSLDCDLRCQSLLERSGNQDQLWLSYMWNHNNRHLFRPQFRYIQNDMDGRAKRRDEYALQLSYSYILPRWVFVANLLYSESSFDRTNPLYGRKEDADTTAIDASVLYRLPVDGGRWQLLGGLFWGDLDSDIDFHDTRLNQVLLGVIYNFGNQPALQAFAREKMQDAAL